MDHGYACVGRSLYVTARNYPDKPAIVEDGRLTLTYRELNSRANQLARYLAHRGLVKGDHIALLLANSVEHVICLYAIAKLGAVAIAIEPRWTAFEIARALSVFDCKFLIANEPCGQKLGADETRCLEFGQLRLEKKDGRSSHLIDMIDHLPAQELGIAVFDDDVFTMILTSGTTGMPKGCIRTHRNVEVGCIRDSLGRRQEDRSRELIVAPLHYGTGRGSLLGEIFLGGTVHLMETFEAEAVSAYIERERITDIALAPTMCVRLLGLPKLDRYDFSSLRALRKAGSPFNLMMTTQLIERVTKNIYQGFASTESGGVTLLKPHEQLAKLGSSGRPRWGVEMEVVDDCGRPVLSGQEGEIRVRGASVCQGYYRNQPEQEAAFRDGWYYTGDMGLIDDEGYLYVKGRLKDIIKTGSINVSPREIENNILTLAGVKDAVVVGVPDPEWGEAVKAIVVLDGDVCLSENDIQQHCRKSLAGFKVPKFVDFTQIIERNELGKMTGAFKAAAIAGTIGTEHAASGDCLQ